jgi:small conductance mechanosensitive channel
MKNTALLDTQNKAELLLEKGFNFLIDVGPKVLGAIAIWLIGSWLIRKLLNQAKHVMAGRGYDISLQKFLSNLLSWALKLLLVITILSLLGIETTSFAAIIASAGLAIGLALQGSLSNFAGGFLIMIFKPFKIGDLIEAQGEMGVVKEIDVFTTKLNSVENREISIPNGILSNGNITNYTINGKLRVDITIGIGYDEDIKKVKEVLLKVLVDNPKVLKDPAPAVFVSELAESSVNFVVRPWVTSDDYWEVYFNTIETIKLTLDKENIEIPYPHSVEVIKQG